MIKNLTTQIVRDALDFKNKAISRNPNPLNVI